ncbi:nucleoside-diphosphate-sugar epimerase [Streptomyces sp. V4I23]|uniref:NAD-dependent epimerase/dehydratase family protein n=1 Tax=Streptomyces sp. V4I23 TaxID=3042282 RepID=UPI00277E9D66|nr:NAD-dependent epimerase/dehydratase family protein [Streptomyces sp. V4I23]MDQ1007074.1 nucleoside-diphosphate-sugar epimerase [Streptomyces sp. V4I23]
MRDPAALEERLSRPGEALVEDLRRLEGDIVVLGAAGKLGPSLVRLAVRGVAAAGTGARVVAVSRFGRPGSAEELSDAGAEVVAADITDENALAALPDAANVVYLVGAKFGTEGNEHATWATNAYLPGRVAERYAGARISALSTGNVYPLVPVGSGGCTEQDPVGPVGEYAMSCLGRERVLTHFARRSGTPMALIRLNYAVEMRYGVLVDLARQIAAKEPVDLTTGFANIVWQGYANEVTLRALLHADVPPFVLNLTGPETLSIRKAAMRMAELLGANVTFSSAETGTALLSDASRCHGLFGYPQLAVDALLTATAEWVRSGLPLLDKPTHFQSRDGKF